jgi:probable rRNA maturation factor
MPSARSSAKRQRVSRRTQVSNRQRRFRIHCREVADFCDRLLDALDEPERAPSVAFVSRRVIQGLNRRFRGKDYPTDVLSFSCADALESERFFLGEIVVAPEVAAAQAVRWRKTLQDEMRMLLAHGLLHLLGFDHERDDGRMLRVQRRLLHGRTGVQAGVMAEPRGE